MLLFQCTKDATDALTFTRKGVTESWVDVQPTPPSDLPWVWMLHAVKIARQNVLVAMQADTRFVMIFWGLKKGDGETLIRLFGSGWSIICSGWCRIYRRWMRHSRMRC